MNRSNSGGGNNPMNPIQQHSHQNTPNTNGTPASEPNAAEKGQLHQAQLTNTHEMSAGSNAQDQQQTLPPQHPQSRYPHRDGPATINLPLGTRIQPSSLTDAVATSISTQHQQQDTAATMSTIYGHQQLYPQGMTSGTPSGYAPTLQTGYGVQMTPAQYYTYNTHGQYYGNAPGAYTVNPQALIMQQHQAAAAYQQILGQSHQGAHGNQMISTSGGVQQVQANAGIQTTQIPHLQQQANSVVTSSGGNISNSGSMQATNITTSTTQQAPKPKRILQFVDPSSGEALKLGADTPPPSTTPANASDEENKSTVIKSEFLKRVSERVKDESASSGSSAQQTRRSPSSFPAWDPSQQSAVEQTHQTNTIPGGLDLQVGGTAPSVVDQHLARPPPPIHVQHPPPHQVPNNPTTLVPSMPIPIEMPAPIIHNYHSPHNLPSILEIKVSQPLPQPPPPPHQLLQKSENEEETKVQENSGIVEQDFSGIEAEEKQLLHVQKNVVPELLEQELNGGEGQSPTPTETEGAGGGEQAGAVSEEKLRELEEEMRKYEGMRNPTHDPEAMVYNRAFLVFLKRVTMMVKSIKCPKSEEELEELGLSKHGMPVSQFNIGTKPRRFDTAGGDSMFKPAWQQPGSGGTQFGGGGTRFGGGSRPPNYMGRHSDNKMNKKKGPVGRNSLNQQPVMKLSQIQHQPETMPKRSANAWKSKREERFDMNAPQKDEEEAKYEKLRKEIRGLLNKITPSTYEELSNDFCAYKINEDPKLLAPIIDLIFDKAVEEPHFCPLYSDLCKKQVDVERQLQGQIQRDKTPDGQQAQQQQPGPKPKEKNFRNAIIFKCQNTFLASKDYDKKMEELQEKLKELDESDEKGRAQIEDELEMRRSKEKRRLLGIIKFIGQLYRHQLLVEAIIDWCAIELIKRFQATADEVYIEYAVELVETVGKIYEQRKEQALQTYAARQQAHQRTAAQVLSGAEPKQEYRLDMVFSHLSQLKPNVSNRVRFAIMDLEDLRKVNWIPRGGEKGPKTIGEVREEVEKEQQEMELERIEHDKLKERDKLQPLRKSSGRAGYGGRSSADRRQAAAVSSLLSRESNKAESRITGLSRLSDLDNMTTIGRKAWQPHRDRTPQKDGGAGGPSSGAGSEGGW